MDDLRSVPEQRMQQKPDQEKAIDTIEQGPRPTQGVQLADEIAPDVDQIAHLTDVRTQEPLHDDRHAPERRRQRSDVHDAMSRAISHVSHPHVFTDPPPAA